MERAKKYVYKIYQTKSFSKAARELYISQPSLSATVKKLELSLGFKIFIRTNNSITLTPEGEVYIDYLEEALEEEKNVMERINNLSLKHKRSITVCGNNFMSSILIPKACGELKRRIKNIDININMGESISKENLYHDIYSKKIDLMITHTCDESRFSFVNLFEERYVIAMRKDYPGVEKLIPFALTREEILTDKQFPEREILDYDLFNDIKFLRHSRGSSIYRHMFPLIEELDFSDCHVYNVSRMDINYQMMLEGLGAIITAESVIAAFPERSNEVLYFLIKSYHNTRKSMIIYKKDTKLSEEANEFISISKELCKNKNEIFLRN